MQPIISRASPLKTRIMHFNTSKRILDKGPFTHHTSEAFSVGRDATFNVDTLGRSQVIGKVEAPAGVIYKSYFVRLTKAKTPAEYTLLGQVAKRNGPHSPTWRNLLQGLFVNDLVHFVITRWSRRIKLLTRSEKLIDCSCSTVMSAGLNFASKIPDEGTLPTNSVPCTNSFTTPMSGYFASLSISAQSKMRSKDAWFFFLAQPNERWSMVGHLDTSATIVKKMPAAHAKHRNKHKQNQQKTQAKEQTNTTGNGTCSRQSEKGETVRHPKRPQ